MHSYRDILQKKFAAEYEKLNEQQRKAVNSIDGPVMVIAGPGTGKTQILAARIGKILLDTDVLPENILCLTYTEAGTIAMRKRLQFFIGADAYKVNISTFHAFCNDVIQDNLYLFEKNSLDAISELESIELFKELIDTFPKGNPLKRYRGDVYYEINNLRSLFTNMKREGWTQEFINQRIDTYIESLPWRDEYIAKRATKEFKKGDVRTDKIAEETLKMEKLRAAVGEFERYQDLMRRKNRYDFDDMINWVIRVFEENSSLLLSYQEKFLYILVDEYQDTSGTQNKLVKLLTGYWEEPNIFVVGDDDQSIYRFQGANVENMEMFMKSHQNLKVVVLENNYRSTQPILDISHTLIEKNQERLIHKNPSLQLTKKLRSSNDQNSGMDHSPEIIEYMNDREEMISITKEVKRLLDEQVPARQIAVIYKENKYGTELARYFRLMNIPVYSKRNINILDDPFIKKTLQILRYIHAEQDIPYGGDEMLFVILHFDFYKIPPIETARVTVEVNEKRYRGEAVSIRKLLSDKIKTPQKDLFDKGLHEGLKKVHIALEQLIADVPNLTLLKLLEEVIGKAGILSYTLAHDQKIRLLHLLTTLFDFVKEEAGRNPSLDLDGLLRMLDIMQKEGIPLSMVQVSGNERSVNLLTVHGSKGLEFNYVFLAGANAAFWEKKRKPGGGYSLPDTLFAFPSQNSNEEELRRLFFVAITRTETHLSISFSRYRNDGKEMEPSMFIAEILEKHPIIIEQKQLAETALAEFSILQFSAMAPEIEKAEEDLISTLLDKFVMNVTALNNYLHCPLEFYYQNLIRIPSGKNEATEFGSAVHFALEKLFRRMQDDGMNRFPSQQSLLDDFKTYLNRHRESFTREAFDRRMEYGDEVLGNYYDRYLTEWNKVVAVERNIRGVVVSHVPLKGKLDKLEFNGKEVNVVDYKTGDIDKAKDKLKAPNDKQPLGGDYWRQAVFYKILVDHYQQKDWKVVSSEFDFIEPDKNKNYRKEKILITPADLETVKQQIGMVWEKIQNREFYTGCGKEDCRWCNFVKDNDLAVALHEISGGEEED